VYSVLVVAVPHDIRNAFARTLAAGLVLSLLAGGVVWVVARQRLGATDEDAVAHIETDVQQRVAESEARLADLTARAAADPAVIRTASRDTAVAQKLFDTLASLVPPDLESTAGVTLYDVTFSPVAWAGRVVDLPRTQLDLAPSVFMAGDPLGPRLVRVDPVFDQTGPASRQRVGLAVAEELLDGIVEAGGIHVAVTPGAGGSGPYAFPIRASNGTVLASAAIATEDIRAARASWMRIEGGAILGGMALMLAACLGPLLELRRRLRSQLRFAIATIALFVNALAVGAIANFSVTALLGRDEAAPYRLLSNALTLLALVWLALDLAERRRLARPHLGRAEGAGAAAATALLYLAAGAAGGALAVWHDGFLRRFVGNAGLDLLHFSLHPLSPSRTAISFALLFIHAGFIWGGALAIRAAAISRRRARRRGLDVVAFASAAIGALAVLAWGSTRYGGMPLAASTVVVLAMMVCAVALSRPRGAFRRASQGARLALLYLALLVPAIAAYPSLSAHVTAAREQLVAMTFAPEAQGLREDLQHQSDRAIEQIDAMADLPALVQSLPEAAAPSASQAYAVWSRTALAQHRITSAIELYGGNRLVSRFALNLPEYTSALPAAASCDARAPLKDQWTTFEEVTSFAASDRHVLRAWRPICTAGGLVGSIVVRVMLDYRTLPFISSQRPYLDAPSARDTDLAEGSLGRGVEFMTYGWSRAPLYSFASGIWPLSDALFDRLVESRAPFWTTIVRDDGVRYRVYLASDRGGIYALGYPITTPFGHLINIAELIVLTLVLWAALLGAATLFNTAASAMPASGRALLREVRSSFYLKLWLAFVGAAAVPVLILAFATRTYFANQFNTSVKEDAVRTATVAQRLVEDYAALQPRPNGTLEALDDQVMILVSQAIDQDVNLFDPKRLQATSQPDLFASGVLPLRTPDDVYRAVALNRLPTFVSEEQVGRATYLLAAARVRAGQREGIVTVPLTLRAQEADQQIDNLDRRVLFASVLFVMFGAGIGYWMAERIADPVNRLTRATRRIARGELDARVAATSSDELRRLVEDFNRMAADLQRQRAELERTQRLEAWADMARQVAHDIKNPLTPIQLSAEHARRVNIDRGRPLSPVLDECVTAILTQVRLLRQIAAEFSSFASSPTARPEPTDLAALIDEVVTPYRAGLPPRTRLDVRSDTMLPPVMIDRNLFARALTNLIENALYAMPGGGTLAISSRRLPVASHQSGVEVTVSDTGTGMDQEALKRLFEPYFSTKASGTGLGLTIAKRNVELIGGTIAVESERGKGTTVRIVLPVSDTTNEGC
jgi:signal transduction histidine kinase